MEVPNIHIVPLTEIDQSNWAALWQAYQAFIRPIYCSRHLKTRGIN